MTRQSPRLSPRERQALALELQRRSQRGQATRDLHDGQRRYLFCRDEDGELERYIHLLSPRRFGKTEGWLRYALDRAQRIRGYRACMIYQELAGARETAWPLIQDLADHYGWSCKLNQNELRVTFPATRGFIKCFGLDKKHRHRQVRGPKWFDVFVDEAQDFYSDLESIIDGIEPGLADYDGRVVMVGTPGATARGYFARIHFGEEGTEHWRRVRGSSWENPHTREQLLRIVANRKKRNPNYESTNTYRREFLGEWVVEKSKLVVPIDPEINYLTEWQPHKGDRYVLGIDWGDNTAFVLACYNHSQHNAVVYLEGKVAYEPNTNEVVEIINDFRKRYPKLLIVTDPGGISKQITRDLTEIHHIPMIHAEKFNREGMVTLLRSDAQLGTIKIFHRKGAKVRADGVEVCNNPESNVVARQWNEHVYVERNGKIEEGRPRDVHDAAAYIRRYVHNHLWREAEKEPERHSPEWWAREEKRIRAKIERRVRSGQTR